MCNRLNGISNAMCPSLSLNGLNLDIDSGFSEVSDVFPVVITVWFRKAA